ncbi:hypothetical protein [Oryza sativa Japonica Group]|uniref:Uncharacterized protein n=1 Tax=Oryza sativa subsp. japonica TaxID=39947 RepID=Q657F5_ORYSJ|nr:hypothetical protein [Oryza sativa Japonica Group]
MHVCHDHIHGSVVQPRHACTRDSAWPCTRQAGAVCVHVAKCHSRLGGPGRGGPRHDGPTRRARVWNSRVFGDAEGSDSRGNLDGARGKQSARCALKDGDVAASDWARGRARGLACVGFRRTTWQARICQEEKARIDTFGSVWRLRIDDVDFIWRISFEEKSGFSNSRGSSKDFEKSSLMSIFGGKI